MVKSFEHITMTTGHVRTSPRSEVDDAIVNLIRKRIAAGKPLGADWTIEIVEAPAGAKVFDLYFMGFRVVTCRLCIDPKASSRFTTVMELISSKAQAPVSAPWLAVEIVATSDIPAPILLEAMQMAGDLERVVAWAFLEAS